MRITTSRRAILTTGLAGLALLPFAGRARATPQDLGDRLYDLVGRYGSHPTHRTGSPDDAATTAWLCDELRTRGAEIELESVPFQRYDWTGEVRIAGREVPTIPYYYESTGPITTTTPFVTPVTIRDGLGDTQIETALREAARSGAAAAVLATTNQVLGTRYADLVAVNSNPARTPSGIATLLISGTEADAAQRGPVSVRFDARRSDAVSHNVLGWFGPRSAEPILITTPLTGWFGCAAERGCGVAIALELCRELSQQYSVLFLGTVAHELQYGGQQVFLRRGIRSRAILHLGASLAAAADSPIGTVLTPARIANYRVPQAGKLAGLLAELTPAGFLPVPVAGGEGALWESGTDPATPMVSLTGTFPQFHTPADTASATTSPVYLAQVYSAVSRAARLLVTD
ncbi:hypothetical protein ACIP5Y_23670 [Nocardia sp. NPDC088792]|uniref:hypothetical protein n=1 Tax=Nocardia sp. NPDC088792 TaxID=3364332 RepID=UPI0037F6AA81